MPHRRLFKKTDSWEYGFETRAHEQPLEAPKKRRTATTLLFAAMFFAGAAFAAFAGDQLAQVTSSQSAASDAAAEAQATTDTTAGDATAADAAPAPDAAGSSDPASAGSASSDTASAAPDAAAADAATAAPSSDASTAAEQDAVAPRASSAGSPAAAAAAPASSAPRSAARELKAAAKPLKNGRLRKPMRVVLLPTTRPAPPPEIEGPADSATVWLNRPLPDPTPPALRLSSRFARHLQTATADAGVNWALELAILRAKGLTGHNPADKATLVALSKRLATITGSVEGDWATALAYDGSPDFADKVQALARYDRAVGLGALVSGLESAKKSLGQRLLDDPSISIYPGGRDDIANGKVDVRVLAVISYLHEAFGEVTVSCLISGHRLYARPGVVSAHIYGRAVDIAALGGTSILGHQQPGGVTEAAVKDILHLPSEVMPRQVISLLGLGGPSFPLADHYNHIHIGF